MRAGDERHAGPDAFNPWEAAAELFQQATDSQIVVVVPSEDCDCMGCHVARLYLLPFLPVTWH